MLQRIRHDAGAGGKTAAAVARQQPGYATHELIESTGEEGSRIAAECGTRHRPPSRVC
jgi:hypothetical protein